MVIEIALAKIRYANPKFFEFVSIAL